MDRKAHNGTAAQHRDPLQLLATCRIPDNGEGSDPTSEKVLGAQVAAIVSLPRSSDIHMYAERGEGGKKVAFPALRKMKKIQNHSLDRHVLMYGLDGGSHCFMVN